MSKSLFNEGWRFTKQEVEFDVLRNMVNIVNNWEIIDVPHDWLIYDTNNLYENSMGVYKKDFFLEDITDKVYRIYFEGVYMDSVVYVNNECVGEWKNGYSSFEFDITKYLHNGENTIIVTAVIQSPNTRWYSGAGIFRDVWLNVTGISYLVSDGSYVRVKKEVGDLTKDSGTWTVEIETEVVCDGEYKLIHTVYDEAGAIVSRPKSCENELTVTNPKIWDIETPNLYTLITELVVEDKVVDSFEQKIGFKTFSIDAEKGFFLNNRHMKLFGVCEHHDLGSLGAAFNKSAMRRKFTELRKMGVNAVRTSHNMPAKGFMELADEMGFLVISEAFDMWEMPKTKFDYARFFKEWHEKDVASWVRRDRNHISLIMWSIGNEVYDTHAGERGREVTIALRELVKSHDPKNNGLITFGSNYMQWEGSQKCGDELDASGYNYGERFYAMHHANNPNRVIYGSETSSTVQSRGIYHFPMESFIVTHKDRQCSSLQNCCTAWGAKTTFDVITNDRDAEFSLGQFIWTGFDYIGEPTPFDTKNSYFGQIDTAGFWKDSAYLYQAEWTDYKKSPMIHLLPYWDFNEGQIIEILAFSNAPVVELFFNDISMGKQEIDHANGKFLAGKWEMAYTPGEITAVAYDLNGNIIAKDKQKSFTESKNIIMKPDKPVINDAKDLFFIEISTTDENSTVVANANNRISIEVSGAGRLVGLDNGDSTDYDQYKSTNRKLFSGKLLAIIASNGESGDITVRAESKGLIPCEINLSAAIDSQICNQHNGSQNIYNENQVESNGKENPSLSEIPCRKIELSADKARSLSPDNNSVIITAKILPETATHRDIKFIAVTNTDIPTNHITIKQNGATAEISAIGDGDFRLRAYIAMSGSMVYSELEFTAKGFGFAAIDAFSFISAGLYTISESPIKIGSLGGLTLYEPQDQYFGFKNVDFGYIGSDEITIPIMSYTADIPIKIWSGIPNATGSVLLVDAVHKVKPQWGKHLENTFKLSKKLTGLQDICMSAKMNGRIDVKGFIFTKCSAYDFVCAGHYKNIYGDSFKRLGDELKKIGNNVTIEYGAFDFDSGIKGIEITGSSQIEMNSVHIKFVDENNNAVNQIVEIKGSDEPVKIQYPLDALAGKHNVSFIFFPGSNFDMVGFRFVL